MTFNKHNLKIIECAAKDETRPALSGLFITENYTCATDSYCLMEVSNPKVNKEDLPIIPNSKPAHYCDPAIIPAKAIQKVLQNLPKNTTLPILQNAWLGSKTDKKTAEILTTDLEIANPVITRKTEAQFPDYKKIIPKDKPEKTINVNPEILIKVLKQFVGFTDSSNVKIQISDKLSPIKISAHNKEQNMVGLVMPLKTEE